MIENGTEVDWADIDNNGIADVVYAYGVKKGSTGYGLFYYNGSAGQWTGDATTGSGWLRGWLDAKEADLTFTDKELFDRVQQSTIRYGGHLFAVKLLDGEVQDILGYDSITGSKNKDFILINVGTDDPFVPKTGGVMLSSLQLGTWDTPKTRNGLTSANSGNAFQFGTDNGNDYTATYTKAVWLHDDGLNQKDVVNNALTIYTDVRYNADNNAIEVGTYTIDVDGTRTPATGVGSYTPVYRLTGSSAKLGDDLYFLNMTGRVNDVTIVFEDNADDAIRQIYVTTRADITAPGGDGSYTSPMTVTGNDVRNISGNSDDLADAVVKGAPNTVIYGGKADKSTLVSNTKGTALNTALGMRLDESTNPANWPDYLFFPYSVNAAAEIGVTFTITDSTGKVVYSELAPVKDRAAGAGISAAPLNASIYQHIFTVNINGSADNAAGVPGGRLTLTKGTYNFSITTVAVTGLVTLSAGSFTIG